MKEIIIAMKPKYLELILNGTKTAEVRRTRPKEPCYWPNRLWLYQGGCIHGYVNVKGYRVPETESLVTWARNVSTELHEKACILEHDMYMYLISGLVRRSYRKPQQIVYLLGTAVRATKPIPVPCRPQSWIYMTDEVRAIVYEHSRKGDQQ